MSALSGHPWARWTVPVAVAAIAVGGGSLVTQLAASADVSLPARSAAQLLMDVQSARLTYGSGTVVQTANLGLPQLPTLGGAGSSDLTSMISGNHTLRVWYGGQSKARLALMGTLGESDVILNGRDLWTWSSDGNSATHRVLSAEIPAKPGDKLGDLAQTQLTPQQVADQALAAIDPTTSVTTDGTAHVAGRSVYELVLAPKDTASLVGQVRIAVDAARHVPLRVQVFAKGGTKPAAEVGFTQISFARPNDAQFRFSPPPGAKVTQASSPAKDAVTRAKGAKAVARPGVRDGTEPVVSGMGWTSVVQAQLPADAMPGLAPDGAATKGRRASSGSADQLMRVLGVLPRESGSWGSGRLLHSSLFNVLLTDDGRILAGAVAPERLYQLAGQPLPAASS